MCRHLAVEAYSICIIPEQFTVKAQRPLFVRLFVCLSVYKMAAWEATILNSFVTLIHSNLLFIFLLFSSFYLSHFYFHLDLVLELFISLSFSFSDLIYKLFIFNFSINFSPRRGLQPARIAWSRRI